MMTNGRTAFLPAQTRLAPLPPLQTDGAFDAVVIGAGITGLTTAWLLGRAGLRVAVVEAKRIGGGVTAFSTGQLTSLIDAGYDAVEKDFGPEGAKAVATVTGDALELVEEIARSSAIACGLRRVPAVLYAEREEDLATLAKEAAAAARAGLPVRSTRYDALPFPALGALVLDDQLDLDPSAYVQGLATALPSNVTLFEHTRAQSIEAGEPCVVETVGGPKLRAPFVVEATHVPGGRNTFHAKTAPYRSYVLAARVERGLPPGIFADFREPYHYLRDHDGLVLLGGEDHKTGQRPDGSDPFGALERHLRERFTVHEIVERWTSEYYAPVDGLPYIGPMSDSGAASHHLIATGFDGDGLLFGTVAGKLLADRVLGRDGPHAELFRPSRTKVLASAARFVKESVNVALHLVGDRLAAAPKNADAVAPGDGGVVDVDGQRCAVFRDEQGRLHVRSATCPHAGCVVQWNADARTFDCPCHGGCFSPLGDVLGGPPQSGLAEVPARDARHEK